MFTRPSCQWFTFEEVRLAIAAPHERGVHVVGNAGEASANQFGVALVHSHVLETPVLVPLQHTNSNIKCQLIGVVIKANLEEECFSIRPSQRSIQFARKSVPVVGNLFRVPIRDSIGLDPPVVVAFEHIGCPVTDSRDCIDGTVLTQVGTIAGRVGLSGLRCCLVIFARTLFVSDSIQCLNGQNVVLMQAELGFVLLVKGCHERVAHTAMAQAERMAELVSCHLENVGARVRLHCPLFLVVKVSIATVLGEVGMGQRVARSVERVAIAVLAADESDVDVHATFLLHVEIQWGSIGPDLECFGNFAVNVGALDVGSRWVLRYSVRQLGSSPLGACGGGVVISDHGQSTRSADSPCSAYRFLRRASSLWPTLSLLPHRGEFIMTTV